MKNSVHQTMILILTRLIFVSALIFFSGCGPGEPGSNQPVSDRPGIPSGPQPRLVVSDTNIELGHHQSGEILTHEIPFTNEGDANLVIQKSMGVGSSITVTHTPDVIPPGESGLLTVRFDTKGRNGEQRRRIVIVSNDPESPRKYLTLTANLELQLGVNPRRIWYGNLSVAEPTTKSFAIIGKNTSKIDPAQLTFEATQLAENITFKIAEKTIPDQKEIPIDVTIDGNNMEPGQFNIPVRIHTGLTETEILTVMLTGNIKGPLTAEPNRLYFGKYQINSPMTLTTIISNESQLPFSVTRVSTNNKLFKAETTTSESGTTVPISVTFQADETTEPRVRAILTVETNLEKHARVDIPLYAFKNIDRK